MASPSGGFRRRMSLRESLRRVGSKLRQSAGRKCRPAVEPIATGAARREHTVGPTVKKCKLEYVRLASVLEHSSSAGERCDRENDYEVIREEEEVRNQCELIRRDTALRRSVRFAGTDSEVGSNRVPRGGAVFEDNLAVEDWRGDENEIRNEYEVIREVEEVRNQCKLIRRDTALRRSVRFAGTDSEVGSNRVPRGGAVFEDNLAVEDWRGDENEIRNEYEVIREQSEDNCVTDNINNYEVLRKKPKKKIFGVEKRHKEIPKGEYEVVRKVKKKRRSSRRSSLYKVERGNQADNVYGHYASNENKYEVCRNENSAKWYADNLVDEYLDRPENKGTLNPAFEDFTLKSNLVLPKSKASRVPFQELKVPLDDSFKENCDPNTVTVQRKRKYSVRFEIREDEEAEEISSRRFGDIIFDGYAQRPTFLKNRRHLQEEDNDSTEELLMKNYELLTKNGCKVREQSNTSKFVRGKFGEISPGKDQKEEEEQEELPEEILPLPVVSFYCEPEDRMPSKRNAAPSRKKMKNKAQAQVLEPKTSSSDIKVLGISTVDSLNQPSTLRTDRLAKIVQKFGPEVLMAMGEDGGDSVLAQFKKSLEKPKEVAVVQDVEEEEWEEDVEEEAPRKRGKKRKLVEDVYEPGSQGPMDVLGRSTSRKKLQHIDIHLHALFAAVEHGHVDKARTILESTDVDVNSVNSDGLTPLDVAVLSNNRALTKVLLTSGAREGNKFGSPEKLLQHLRQLASEAERRVGELGGAAGLGEDGPRSAPPYNVSGQAPVAAASDKTLALWERRCKGLNKLIQGFQQARPPDVPFLVAVDVTGTHSVTVRFQEPESSDSPPCTKFRVEWTTDPDWATVAGHREIVDVKQTELSVDGLSHGQCYYFRVACGNICGFSPSRPSQPTCATPSSWRDVTGRDERLPPGGLALLDRLFAEVRSSRPDLKGLPGEQGPGETPVGQRRKKTTIKQLFTAASKFQKHLRRGVFLSCLLYHEDRVLVTNEDFLPVIEVDETYPGSIYHDFHWLLKVACTWDDVKWLRQDMEKSLSSSAVHFRIKLLQAAAQMQTALSIQDLGQLYHKPLRDSEGTIVICTVNYAHSPKAVSVLNSRWLPLGKLSKRAPPTSDANISEILMSTIQDQITYHQVSSIRLPRGLYLSYLKMRSCVDLLQVLVPSKSPNIPPHCKIRDNPHVTAEEWRALAANNGTVSEHQRVFVEQVAATARRLFTYMEVSVEDAAMHRLYDLETVEISPDVSLLMVVPPVDSACSVPGQRETLLQRPDLLPLPVQVFEMVHLGTYRHQVVSRYSRLSCIIELDMALAQHSQREAFSSSELTIAKERLARLEALQSQLNAAWKQSRWLLDVLAFARDRLSHSPTSMRHLLAFSPKRSRDQLDSQNGLLQPPDPKAVKSRGSWPGPGTGRLLGTVAAELSRSEQHLSNSSGQASPPPLPPPRQTPPDPPSTNSPLQPGLFPETVCLPPSRSEDTLVVGRKPRCSVSATTSPLLHSLPQYGSGSLHSLSSDDSAIANHSKSEGEEEGATVPAPAPGILQVYAAYDTGLAAGTSLKLHVSPRTSAREVVDLVVKQLNMAVVLKGKDGPIYPADQLGNFCLVAVIGARERCLRDDFKPLQLQNPWKKGRLYVRQKHDVLAALEHSSRHSAFL